MAWSEDGSGASRPTAGTRQQVDDGNDLAAIEAAIEAARADERPSLIAVRTHIGFGSPNKQDSQKAHGAPLGPDEVRLTKEAYGWDPDLTFYVPGRGRGRVPRRGRGRRRRWSPTGRRAMAAYADAHPDLAAELRRRLDRELADGWDADLKVYETGTEVATRNASQDAIQALAGPSRSCSAGRPTSRSRT